MTQNAKQFMLVLIVAAIMFGGPSWMIPASKEPGVWWVRIGSLVVLAAVWGFFRWAAQRRELAPDFLSTLSGTFFEQAGLSFVVTTEVINRVCHLCVWFQNRYEGACSVTVLVCPSERWLAPHRYLPNAKVTFTCEPGAFGKVLAPWPLPAALQGRKVLVDVMAKRKYLESRGKLLRHRTGLTVGSIPMSGVTDVLKVLGALGGFGGRRAARTEVLLPQNVQEVPPTPFETRVETVWKLGSPVPPTEVLEGAAHLTS